MNQYISFGIIFVILFCLEVVYFKIAERFNIIDKPNERSSHSSIVLRGGGIIFMLSVVDLERVLRVPVCLVLIGRDLDRGGEFRG